jgi:hypothetical protein
MLAFLHPQTAADKRRVTVQVSFRPEGEIFRATQISPRSTRRNDNDLNRYNAEKEKISIISVNLRPIS